jgi:hypothetical protein
MQINPDAVVFHGYVAAVAVIVGLLFGLGWALLPVVLGLLVTVAAS